MPFIDNELYNADAVRVGLRNEVSTATLAKWRCSGFGPKFVRAGRTPLYLGKDINAWLSSRTVSHTNESTGTRRPTNRGHRLDKSMDCR